MSAPSSPPAAKMVVVPHNPRRLPLLVAGWLATVLAAIAIATLTTSAFSRARIQNLQAELLQSQGQIESLEAQINELQQQVTNYRLAGEIDRAAAEGVRQEVIGLQTHITELEAEITFYKGLMDPSASNQGVSFSQFEVSPTGEPGLFSYRVVVQQVAANHKLFKGNLAITVSGRENGQPRQLSLSDVSSQSDDNSIKLRFKYFQIVEGEFRLPEGFNPGSVEMEVNAGKQGVVSQQFDWQIQES